MTSNQLKILALVSMTIDHLGLMIFPDALWMRGVGRLAFPIFAFCIAEGCHYTHDKRRYLGTIVLVGAICQIGYWLGLGSLSQSILTTLAIAVVVIYAFQHAVEKRTAAAWALFAAVVAVDAYLCIGLPRVLRGTGFHIDYGFIGTLLPLACYLPRALMPDRTDKDRKRATLVCAAVALVALAAAMDPWISHLQWLSLVALVPIALYNGERGALKLKHLFYVYYPAHLVVIWAVSQLL